MTNNNAPQNYAAFMEEARSHGGLPLSNHQVCSTMDVAEVHRQVGRALCGHNARSLTDRHPERIAALHCAPLSDTTAIYMQYGVETKVRVEELGFFLLDVPLSGACETVFGLDRAHTKPGAIVMAGPGR